MKSNRNRNRNYESEATRRVEISTNLVPTTDRDGGDVLTNVEKLTGFPEKIKYCDFGH